MEPNTNTETQVLELKAVYTKAADNKDVTFTFGIERINTNLPIQNEIGGKTGVKPSNTDKEKFQILHEKFMSEVSFNQGHGTIHGIDGNDWRIDQQGNEDYFHNIQFQAPSKKKVSRTFANVVVNTVIQPKPAPGKYIDMKMEVFAQRQGMKAETKQIIRTVYDVNELDKHREEKSRINMYQRINKIVGQALAESFYNKVKYEVNVLLLEQN